MSWPNNYGYCTEPHAQAMTPWVIKLPATYTTTSQPTLAQVQGWITEVSQLIDARAARMGFVTPATTGNGYGATTISVLQTWSTTGVAGRIVMSTENKVLAPGDRTTGQMMWASFLKWLADDEQVATAFSQADTQAAGFSTGIADPDPITGCAAAPIFSVSQRF